MITCTGYIYRPVIMEIFAAMIFKCNCEKFQPNFQSYSIIIIIIIVSHNNVICVTVHTAQVLYRELEDQKILYTALQEIVRALETKQLMT